MVLALSQPALRMSVPVSLLNSLLMCAAFGGWPAPPASGDPGEADSLFEPAADKVYRHPTFYSIPENIKNI